MDVPDQRLGSNRESSAPPNKGVQVVFFNNLTGVATDDPLLLPSDYTLTGNYPNPFREQTRIGYELPQSISVLITIFDAMGREIWTLDSEEQAAGRYEVIFDADGLPSGTYFYRLTAGSITKVGRAVPLQ